MSKPILLIDDEEKFAQMLQELLQLSGYESDYCLNPEEAIAILGKEDYDLVITDYKMPEMDGAEFLQKARKINPDLPVIMISGLMNMSELIKVANIGVTLVLEKPFKTEDLLEHVARFVRTDPEKETTPQALGIEASELNFQSAPLAVTYPSPASHFADASTENKHFLESIWKTANTCRHIPFYAQPGAEIRLLAREIMEWTDLDPEAEVVRIDNLDTGTGFTRNWILETNPFPAVLVIDLRDGPWKEETLDALADWINFVEGSGQDLSLARILYVLPTGVRFVPGELPIDPAFRDLLAEDCPVLMPLRDRVLDVALYLGRLLDREERKRLGPRNLKRLLHYSWPGGYQELSSRVGSLKAHLAAGEELDEGRFMEILSDRGADSLALKGSLSLEGYLCRRQREYVLLHREQGEDLKNTLHRLGIEEPPVDPELILKDGALVYPELLNEPAS